MERPLSPDQTRFELDLVNYPEAHAGDVDQIKTAMDYRYRLLDGISVGDLYHGVLNSEVFIELSDQAPMTKPTPVWQILSTMKPRYGRFISVGSDSITSQVEYSDEWQHWPLDPALKQRLEYQFQEHLGPDVDMMMHMITATGQAYEWMNIQNTYAAEEQEQAGFKPHFFTPDEIEEMMIVMPLHDLGEMVRGDLPDGKKTAVTEAREKEAIAEVLDDVLAQVLSSYDIDPEKVQIVRDMTLAHAFGEKNEWYNPETVEAFRSFEVMGYVMTGFRAMQQKDVRVTDALRQDLEPVSVQAIYSGTYLDLGRQVIKRNVQALRTDGSDPDLQPNLTKRYPYIEHVLGSPNLSEAIAQLPRSN